MNISRRGTPSPRRPGRLVMPLCLTPPRLRRRAPATVPADSLRASEAQVRVFGTTGPRYEAVRAGRPGDAPSTGLAP